MKLQNPPPAAPPVDATEIVMECAGIAVDADHRPATALSDDLRLAPGMTCSRGKAVSPLRFATAVQDHPLAGQPLEQSKSSSGAADSLLPLGEGQDEGRVGSGPRPQRTAGFSRCHRDCVADFQIGGASESQGGGARDETTEYTETTEGEFSLDAAFSKRSGSGIRRHQGGEAVCLPQSPFPVVRVFRGCSFGARRAFTLIELLVVIAIIGVLAALIIPVASSVGRVKKINTAQAELQQIATALENYKAKYGVYPPGNGTNGVVNQLYYELSGVTKNGLNFQTLDGNTTISTAAFGNQFNGAGVLNCSQGGGEEGVTAKNFLPGLKANEITYATNCPAYPGVPYYYLVTSVGGPDVGYNPLPSGNPFRYVSPGVHNPNSYDLWVQLSINSTPSSPHLYLVCNWSQQVQRNSPMP